MKQKTQKSISKRLKITKTGKIMKRRGGQDHFNSRDSGKKVKNKRRDNQLSESLRRSVRTQLPRHKV